MYQAVTPPKGVKSAAVFKARASKVNERTNVAIGIEIVFVRLRIQRPSPGLVAAMRQRQTEIAQYACTCYQSRTTRVKGAPNVGAKLELCIIWCAAILFLFNLRRLRIAKFNVLKGLQGQKVALGRHSNRWRERPSGGKISGAVSHLKDLKDRKSIAVSRHVTACIIMHYTQCCISFAPRSVLVIAVPAGTGTKHGRHKLAMQQVPKRCTDLSGTAGGGARGGWRTASRNPPSRTRGSGRVIRRATGYGLRATGFSLCNAVKCIWLMAHVPWDYHPKTSAVRTNKSGRRITFREVFAPATTSLAKGVVFEAVDLSFVRPPNTAGSRSAFSALLLGLSIWVRVSGGLFPSMGKSPAWLDTVDYNNLDLDEMAAPPRCPASLTSTVQPRCRNSYRGLGGQYLPAEGKVDQRPPIGDEKSKSNS
ncbi:hypothetical protein FIBSPDRAFT_925532 [Athelia psychrophila]|uniref:Uncharacterized protein n=1 Tax=Athelia psychrophila TaxID=1759441 RepID=A0A166UGJ6_9AGAM|nr:hypothetical protein FIBSPDRAFT_925532 [Fibularhizoctonia sp. CBS 109695]